MKRIEYRTLDKSDWGPGPWQDEPDKVQWLDEATGYPCMIRRGTDFGGFWCGYVGIPKSHPDHGKGYDDTETGPRVHGGLTFADKCSHGDEATAICHVVEPGEDDDVWWFGFDCGHAWDHMPARAAFYRAHKIDISPVLRDKVEVYRDQAYVTAEVESLARQLKERAEMDPMRLRFKRIEEEQEGDAGQ